MEVVLNQSYHIYHYYITYVTDLNYLQFFITYLLQYSKHKITDII